MKSPTPWLLGLGAAASPTAWFVAQQAAGSLSYFACQSAGPPLGILVVGLLGLVPCGLAAALSWRQLHLASAGGPRFTAQLCLGLAAIFALTLLVTLLAIWLVPPCAR